jgi:hypothetical protein
MDECTTMAAFSALDDLRWRITLPKRAEQSIDTHMGYSWSWGGSQGSIHLTSTSPFLPRPVIADVCGVVLSGHIRGQAKFLSIRASPTRSNYGMGDAAHTSYFSDLYIGTT